VRESKTRPVMRSAKEKSPASVMLTGLHQISNNLLDISLITPWFDSRLAKSDVSKRVVWTGGEITFESKMATPFHIAPEFE